MRFGSVFSVSMAVAIAANVPGAHAWTPEAPLPPSGVSAVWTEGATVVSWLPSVAPLTTVTGYAVYRMDEPGPASGWTQIGTTSADTLSLADPAIQSGVVAFYYVVALSPDGPSPPSQPAASGGMLTCIHFEIDENEPPWEWVDVSCDPDGVKLHVSGGG